MNTSKIGGKKKEKSKRYWDNKCCKLWSQIVILKAGRKCEKTGASGDVKQLHPHHYIGRKNKLLKFDIRNGVCLSAYEHVLGSQSAHNDPEGFREWFKVKRPADFKYICEKRKIPPRPFSIIEYKQTFEDLNEQLIILENQ